MFHDRSASRVLIRQSPPLGVGLGLRTVHYDHILKKRPKVPWFEVISENYMGTSAGSGGRAIQILEDLRKDYPIALHGVSLSIGSTDHIDKNYLKKLKALIERIDPLWVSDHLCWTGVNGHNLHDLLPLPYTKETVKHLVKNINRVQDFLGRQILLENVSSYVSYQHSEMTEWECLTEVANQADCLILLDVNNIYVNSVNHRYDAEAFLKQLPAARIRYLHIAGHYREADDLIVDTHGADVVDPVWQLLEKTYQHFGVIPTLLERDFNLPPLADLLQEVEIIHTLQSKWRNQNGDYAQHA